MSHRDKLTCWQECCCESDDDDDTGNFWYDPTPPFPLSLSDPKSGNTKIAGTKGGGGSGGKWARYGGTPTYYESKPKKRNKSQQSNSICCMAHCCEGDSDSDDTDDGAPPFPLSIPSPTITGSSVYGLSPGGNAAASNVSRPGGNTAHNGFSGQSGTPADYKMADDKITAVRRQFKKDGLLFEDGDFPCVAASLYTGTRATGVDWRRPKDLYSRPVYIHDSPDYFDIIQGDVGNCWFVASVACLAASKQKHVLNRVVPRGQSFGKDYCGAFHFYFWKFGQWEEVVVDDRLPSKNGRLLYGQNGVVPEEFWCPLLEKAYAKFYGGYQALDGGQIHRALVDMTGGLGERVDLGARVSRGGLRGLLLNSYRMNSVLGAGIMPVPGAAAETKMANGLYKGHAYSIINVKEVKSPSGPTVILHVRNPWGKCEWNGAWSDGSPQWRTLKREDSTATTKEGLTKEDGSFWISLEDFRDNFDELEMCHMTPDSMSEEIADNLSLSQWRITEHQGAWVRGVSAGGPCTSFTSQQFWSNPQYELSLKDTGRSNVTVVVSLMKEKGKDDLKISFVIIKLGKDRKPTRITADNVYDRTGIQLYKTNSFMVYRERTRRFSMTTGCNYVIVPCTMQAGQEGRFYMRLFCEGDLKVERASVPVVQPDSVEAILDFEDPSEHATMEDFDRLAGASGHVDREGVVSLLQGAGGDGAILRDKETCRCLVPEKSRSIEANGISKEGFKKILKDLGILQRAFRANDANHKGSLDPAELKQACAEISLPDSAGVRECLMRRFATREGRLLEADFIQGVCRAMQLDALFHDNKKDEKLSLSYSDWMSLGFTY